MARTKHTMRRRRHRGGGEDATTPPVVKSTWESLSETFGDLTKSTPKVVVEPTAVVEPKVVEPTAEEPTAEVEQSAGRKKRRRGLHGGYAGSVKYPGVASYATAVGGRRRCHKGGSHGVGVSAYASPYTQGGGRRRRRRTRRRHYKK